MCLCKQSCLVYLNSNSNDFFETLPRMYLLCFFGSRFIKTGIVGYNKNISIITQLSSGHDVMEVLLFFVIWLALVILFDIKNGLYCLLLQNKDRVRVHLGHCSPSYYTKVVCNEGVLSSCFCFLFSYAPHYF